MLNPKGQLQDFLLSSALLIPVYRAQHRKIAKPARTDDTETSLALKQPHFHRELGRKCDLNWYILPDSK